MYVYMHIYTWTSKCEHVCHSYSWLSCLIFLGHDQSCLSFNIVCSISPHWLTKSLVQTLSRQCCGKHPTVFWQVQVVACFHNCKSWFCFVPLVLLVLCCVHCCMLSTLLCPNLMINLHITWRSRTITACLVHRKTDHRRPGCCQCRLVCRSEENPAAAEGRP